jgi:crotonobetainyl-CoA:carnitine CoA-transferase CaiB-like acyl-CoA transferase
MTSAPLPLSGLRVLDLSRVLAGPFCAMMLANLGADVIKVEDKKGDESRAWVPFTKDLSDSFTAVNLNKRGIVVDLKSPDGQQVIRDLVKTADVLVENFKTGTMERFGLGYDSLEKINPGLVFVSIAAYGRKGPRAEYPGYETLLQAYSGIMSFTGMPDGEPVRTGVSFLDLSSGVIGALAAVTALYRRKETGRGGKVEGSLLQSALGLMTVQLTPFFQNGLVPRKLGSGHASATPYQAFQTADGWILIAAANQNLWEKLAQAIGVEALLKEPKYKDNPGRMANLKEFLSRLNPVIAGWETRKLEDHLVKAGVPCSKLNTVDQLLADGQVNALDPFNEVDDPEYGHFKVPGTPFHLQGMDKPALRRPPKLGEHTREVLREIGYDDARIEDLLSKGAVACAGPAKPAAAG